jgi:ribosomal protein L37AE/L43A
MGAATCEKCEQTVDVPRADQPWRCPACGRANGERVWQRVAGAGVGVAFVVVGVLLVVTLVAVLAAYA